MGISEAKKQIVIDNYFKNTCDVNTSIKEAFTKGFEVGLTKAVFPKDQYEARLKADIVAILDRIRAKIKIKYGQCNICEYFENYDYEENDISEYRPIGDINDILQILDDYKAESEDEE